MKSVPFLLGLTLLAAWHSGAFAAPRPQMSPAGQAAYQAAFGKFQSELLSISRRRSAAHKTIALALQSEHPDWKLLNTLLKKDYLDDLNMRRLAKSVDDSLLATLPEPDRIIYLQDKYSSSMPPVVISPAKP